MVCRTASGNAPPHGSPNLLSQSPQRGGAPVDECPPSSGVFTMDGFFTSFADALGASVDQIKVSILFQPNRMIDFPHTANASIASFPTPSKFLDSDLKSRSC